MLFLGVSILVVFLSIKTCESSSNVCSNRCYGTYCSGSYITGAECVNGTCQCLNNPMRDRCTCLSIVGSCHIQNQGSDAVATARFSGNLRSTSSCVANDNSNYEVHIIGNYEGNGHTGFRIHNTGYTNLYMTITGSSSRPLILVLSSYEPIQWTLHIPTGVVLDKVILSSYYNNSIVYAPGQVLAVENSLRLFGYGSDAGGGKTHQLLTTLYERFGPISSFTGTYKADEWRLTINRGDTTPTDHDGPTISTLPATSQLASTQATSTPGTSLINELKAILDNHENSSCAKTCEAIEIELDRFEAKMDRKLDTLMDIVSSVQNQLLTGKMPSHPANSCADILDSGYYWIKVHQGRPSRQYCDSSLSCGGVTGGWRRVAKLDMRDSTHHCPSGLRQRTDSSTHTCVINSNSPSCSSVSFSSGTLEYSKVCGKIRAIQFASTDGFRNIGRGPSPSIDTYYVDGVSLTHGSPRQHIWTFAAAVDESGIYPESTCPCTKIDQVSRATLPPTFVGNDYFCDTGSRSEYQHNLYTDDPLWDGTGCGSQSTCCSFNNPPWFFKQLPQITTDDIEMRICRDQSSGDEDIAVEAIEIYVQ